MSAPIFEHSTQFVLQDQDLLLLPYRDGDQPCFSSDSLPAEVLPATAPEKEGKSRTVFAGVIDGRRVLARAVRLDTKHTRPEAAIKKAVAQAISLCEAEDMKRVLVLLDDDQSGLVHAVHEGAVTGGYRFDKYLSDKPELPAVTAISGQGTDNMEARIEADAILFKYVNLARDLLNEPPNVINPSSLSATCISEAREAGIDITVWDEERLRQEGCGGILSVGKGSSSPPRLIIMRYWPEHADRHLALVGKGITFDTGGYCLKPASGQIGMKYDMGGAAAVLGAGMAIAALRLPVRLTVIAPLAENDISSTAYHTTDIITMRNGKTVQVDNTDAEGRLILADALSLACEYEPDWIIDAATLTGACCVALGEDIAGLFASDEKLGDKLVECGRACDEIYWPLPLHMPYIEELKATAADCKNIGGKWGGALTAALFLKQFVKDEIPWIHLDIAGPAVKEEPLGHLGKGAKGFAVKTLVRLAQELT